MRADGSALISFTKKRSIKSSQMIPLYKPFVSDIQNPAQDHTGKKDIAYDQGSLFIY